MQPQGGASAGVPRSVSTTFQTVAESIFAHGAVFDVASRVVRAWGSLTVTTPALPGVHPIAPGDGAFLNNASVVNAAFAGELYLKCLIRDEGHTPHGKHKLKSLFLELNGKTQTEIRRRYAEIVGKASPAVIASGTTETNLDKALDESNRSFDQFRYLYEVKPRTTTSSTFSAGLFVYVLRTLILARHPAWARHSVHMNP